MIPARSSAAWLILAGLVLAAGAIAVRAETPPRICTYQLYFWNATSQSPAGNRTVRHPYAEVSGDEVDAASGCTVCEEDQAVVHLPPLKPFRFCRKYAPALRAALERLLASGAPLFEIDGYRAGRTRGPLDAAGNRTAFSSHAYGTAVDINRSLNGFYHDCPAFSPRCRLMQGGPWRPGVPGTLTADSPIVLVLKAAGFKWGGEEDGTQKDFMHISLTGY